MTAPLRKSVPVTPEVADLLDRLKTQGADEAAAVAELADVDTSEASEAQTLATIVDLGRRLIEEKAREGSYRRLAAIDAVARERDQERAAFLVRRAERERRRSAEEAA